ncbi:MAG: hypothetical protein A2X94_14045 [Bdellovibrionales bacterium GWB1_55_8]|nr:MAG: hypothetical protein A2X94_14045 [Bdellovibrionales bacterium GWB1_55_8]
MNRIFLNRLAVIMGGVMGTLIASQSWAAIESSSTLVIQGRVPEIARMEIAHSVEFIDYTTQATGDHEPVARIGIHANTGMMPPTVRAIRTPSDADIFTSRPEVAFDGCDLTGASKNGKKVFCTIKASWQIRQIEQTGRTKKIALAGSHPLWLQVTLSSI